MTEAEKLVEEVARAIHASGEGCLSGLVYVKAEDAARAAISVTLNVAIKVVKEEESMFAAGGLHECSDGCREAAKSIHRILLPPEPR